MERQASESHVPQPLGHPTESLPAPKIHTLEQIAAVEPAAADEQAAVRPAVGGGAGRSEEHTSELQSLMRISYAVFCLKKKKKNNTKKNNINKINKLDRLA